MKLRFPSKLATLIGLGLLSCAPIASAQVTPGGTFADKAIITEATGGEQLARATGAATLGPLLVHDFDTPVTVDGSYEFNPGAPTQIALSSGRHLVLYSTRFDANAGANRAEIQTGLRLDGTALAAGRSQGFIRRTGGADETVISGGAIITVAADDDILTLESARSDNNPNAAVLPTRVANGTSIELLKLDDSWDHLSVERGANGAGVDSLVSVTYDTNNSPGTMGTAFSFTANSTDVTLNEAGLYLVFANTGIFNVAANVRTNYEQILTLDGAEVALSKTSTYVRGNANGENARDGVAARGMIVSATAGQVLNVRVRKEGGGQNGTVQGGKTALTIVKLPFTARYIELTDTTNQNVVDATLDVVSFDTQTSASNSVFTHSGSTVTVNEDSDYLFLGSLSTLSDTTLDNHARVIPVHGWQVDGTPINRGKGAAYNRDNGNNRASGSWSGTLLDLTSGQTVEMTSLNVGTARGGFPNIPGLQALSISSLVISNDPVITVNAPLDVVPGSTGNVIGTANLDTFDNDTPEALLIYTVDSAPAGGTLRNAGVEVMMGGTFNQTAVDAGLITFDAGPTESVGGFDFTVSDGTGSDSSTFVVNVVYPTTVVTISHDGDVTEGGDSDFIVDADVAPDGSDMTVTVAYSGTSTSGVDFNGATTVDITNGTTSAALNITTLVDGIYEGAESITATITDASGATVNTVIGTPASATFYITDSGNSGPIGTNLTQSLAAAATVAIDDILVMDPDGGGISEVITGATPVYTYNGVNNVTTFGDGRPTNNNTFQLTTGGPGLSEAAGYSLEVDFTPQAADLTGTVMIWEVGGSSNGSALLLIDGIPHIMTKANGNPAHEPVDSGDPGFVDTNWDDNATDNTVVIPLTSTALTAGIPARGAIVFDIVGGTVKHSFNGSAEATTALSAASGTNFVGDHTVNHGQIIGGIGGETNLAGPTAVSNISSLSGGPAAVTRTVLWNDSTGSASGTAGGAPEIVTATLTIRDWAAGAGDLTAASGNGESYAAGVWMVMGDAGAVNAALAAVEFISGGGTTDPTIIEVSIADGGEDGAAPAVGAIIISSAVAATVYVDDSFPTTPGGVIADADGGPPASPAIFGYDAFATIADAIAAVDPAGTIIVNDGDYSTENVVLADTVTLQLTDTAGPVQIGNLGAGQTNSIVLQGNNTLVVGATNIAGPGINSAISGTGNFTKVGTALFVVREVNTYTGTTTVLNGMLRIGHINALDLQSELAGDGPVVVTAPGRLELNVDVNKTLNQTGVISGTGSVGTLGDGTVIFDNPGANTFSGGFELGDGATSSFDGVDQGAIQGFVVVNHNGHLGTGKVLSRGSQLQAGTPGLVIPNDIDITGGGFRCGGTIGYELSGNVNPIDGTARGYGNYGLEGCDLTISGNITMTTAGENVNFEGSNGRDNGTWTITGDISGPANILLQNSFDDGVVTFEGNNTYAAATNITTGTFVHNGTHTGGGQYTVSGGATMTGSGSTTSPVTIQAGTTFSPVGTFGTGDLIVLGALALDIGGISDQVVTTGTVDVTGGTLVLTPGVGIAPGSLILIDNDDAADVVTGPFTGLAEGGAIDPATGLDATITYMGGGGDTNDVALAITGYTAIAQWRIDNYGDPANAGAGANDAMAANGLTNLQSFAMALDPNVPAGMLDVDADAGTITTLGGPSVWVDPDTGRIFLRHTRRTDFAALGLTITDQFSRDLTGFEDSAVAPAVIATGTGDGGVAIQAVQTEFPFVLPISGGKGRYGRVDVTIAP